MFTPTPRRPHACPASFVTARSSNPIADQTGAAPTALPGRRKTANTRAAFAPILAACALLAITGCGEGDGWFNKKKEKPPEPKAEKARAYDALVSDTVGDLTLIADNFGQRLRGFGIVVGLGDNGGGDCPTTVRQYLIDYINREQLSAGRSRPRVSAEKLLDSPDTAVVSVYGTVPPGSPVGTHFDLQVDALSSQTKSLEGGLLLPCELKIFEPSASGQGLIAGAPLAKARGPVFVNPFKSDEQTVTRRDQRRAIVLGGGLTTIERTYRLMLREPAYPQARQIERRLNEQFGHNPPVAEAMSKGYVTIKTPPAYRDAPERFMQLAPHVFLTADPAALDRRLREFNEQLASTRDNREALGLAWEAIGKAAIPSFQVHYGSSEPGLRFYAARAGLRLKDNAALPVMVQIANSPNDPFRLPAVHELELSGFVQATTALERLLDDTDQEVRIAAYEGLKGKPNGAIVSRRFPHPFDPTQVNLILDVVRTSGKPFVYVARTREPRIALFGENVSVNFPMFYQHPQGWVTINASDTERQLTVFSRTRTTNRLSDKLQVGPRLLDLLTTLADLPEKDANGRFRGLAQPYSVIVQVLDELHRSDAIGAPVVLERRSLAELLGPTQLPDRPEGDLPADDPDPVLPKSSAPSSAPAERPE